MIDISVKHIKSFEIVIIIIAILALVIVLGSLWGELLQNICFGFLMTLGALGILAALLERIGVLRFVYSMTERNSCRFKMARDCAALEKSIWGSAFSDSYYENYLKDDRDEKEVN